ncbi:hypothetical protein QCA50_010753 [Cerrena zonata]|uniref:DUF7729 domain-containing protein n=1 Tax=Cerrena zonata TaxID=2478898 RepID=A0AAW0FWS9_9APHY
MFTPPPSPTPFRVAPPRSDVLPASEKCAFLTPGDHLNSLDSSSTLPDLEPISLSTEAKQRTARRTKWTILLVPTILLLITASTRYLSHPAAFDTLSGEIHESHEELPSLADWHLHKRHPQAQSSAATISFPTPTSSSTSSAASATASSTDQNLPTIPQSPPVLPTPFPRPLTAVNQNFSTLGCQNFFTNMTSSEPFLDCRPVSLLIKTSADFIQQAQTNLTALNTIIWGTCNTDTNADQCVANMDWFADSLKSSCSQELSNDNSLVTDTLIALQAYSLMRDAVCMADPSTNAYCYVEATHNINPSDLYFYQLPFGVKLPQSTKPSCSSCTKSLMSLYTQSLNISALSTTYEAAAQTANGACGAGYVQTTTVTNSATTVDLSLGALLGAFLMLVSFTVLS